MSGDFFDTNVVVYSAGKDPGKAARSRQLINVGGVVSVQVLNEIANVTRRKQRMSWTEAHAFLSTVKQLLAVWPLTVQVHDKGLDLAERYQLSIYDAMIAAAALEAGCDTLYSEDMHDGLVIDGQLTVTNPFRVP